MNKKIKILYLTTASKLSGAEKQLYELARRIDKEKYEVMVCTIMDDLQGHLLDRLKKEGIKTDYLSLNRKWKAWKAFKLLRIIKHFNPDILQSFLFFDNILARVFGRLAGVPIIISGERSAEIHRSKIRNFFDRTTINLANYVIVNSEAGKKIVIKRDGFPEEKIKIIYNGINLSRVEILERNHKLQIANHKQSTNSKTQNTNDLIKIGFVGRLGPQKGLNYLIEAVAILKNKTKGFAVYIIGEGPERNNLEKLVRDSDVENIICFLGYKERAWEYIREFDLLVLPSLWEGFPNVVMEAMACSVSVIATKVSGVPELIEDGKTGFLVEPKNSKKLADKIEYVLNLSEEEKKKIIENARKALEEKFSIERMVKDYDNFYREVLR